MTDIKIPLGTIVIWIFTQITIGSLWGFLFARDDMQVWIQSHIFFGACILVTILIHLLWREYLKR